MNENITDLCNCGSGRKYINCCGKKIKTDQYQRIKFKVDNVPFQRVQFRFYSDATTKFGLKMYDENKNEIKTTMYEIEEYRERENKNDKIVFSQPILNNRYIEDVNLELTKYDVIVAIDTSYELINDTKIAFTSVMIFSKMSKQDDNTYNYQQIADILEWDATTIEHPENLMYAHVIENIRLHNIKYFDITPNIAVIIDSDLGNINSFNERTKPIYEDFYLPDNFHLFYASTDIGSDTLQNKLLKLCDKEAKNALKEYKNDLLGT
ncbi:MAG: hypothetical protein APF84_13250 [Gracilibacter sp. BRH_c7a]|nr:MAG: hypothetical protein APF84_13250 [Gracilibacter sp. BRH_c7a]